MTKYIIGSVALSMMVYGQVPGSEWMEVPATALLGGILCWILFKAWPAERRENRDHTEHVLKEVGTQFEKAQERQAEQMETLMKAIITPRAEAN